MNGNWASLLTVLALAIVHVYAGTVSVLHRRWHSRTLSAAAGIGVAYVFLELMPALAEDQIVIEQSGGLLSFVDRDVYILALVGLAVSLWVETVSRSSRRRQRRAGKPDVTGMGVFWLSVASFFVFNAATGYAVASPGDQAVEPLWMFALAMGLHTLVNDHSIVEHHGEKYRRIGRWLLVFGLLVGWSIGITPGVDIPARVLAPVLAYLAGGFIMNILRHELPDTDRATDVAAFAIGAASYAVLLFSLGPVE